MTDGRRLVDVDAVIDLVAVFAAWMCFAAAAWLLIAPAATLAVVGAALLCWVLDWPRPARARVTKRRVKR